MICAVLWYIMCTLPKILLLLLLGSWLAIIIICVLPIHLAQSTHKGVMYLDLHQDASSLSLKLSIILFRNIKFRLRLQCLFAFNYNIVSRTIAVVKTSGYKSVTTALWDNGTFSLTNPAYFWWFGWCGLTQHIQMLCPRGSGPGFESDLWLFAACLPSYHSPWRSSVEEHRSRRTGKQSRKVLDVPVDESTKTRALAQELNTDAQNNKTDLETMSWTNERHWAVTIQDGIIWCRGSGETGVI